MQNGEVVERRGEGRRPVAWHGRVQAGEGQQDCEVLNISCNGVQIAMAESLPLQAEVSIDIDHLGGFQGRVVWREADRYGVRFDAFSPLVSHFLGCWTSLDNAPGGRRI